MDTMDKINFSQELIRMKLVISLIIEETIHLKPRPSMESVMHGDNMDMKNSETQEEIHSKKQKENSKIKLSKAQESTSIK